MRITYKSNRSKCIVETKHTCYKRPPIEPRGNSDAGNSNQGEIKVELDVGLGVGRGGKYLSVSRSLCETA